jgi:hypothetical protein
MKLERLKQLRRKLIQEKDLSKIWSFYTDEFADRPEFLDVGEPKPNEFIEAVVPQICQQIFGKKVKITDLMTIYLAEYNFFHAPFLAEGRIGGLIYFEEERIGLLAVSAKFPPTDEVKYSRFSATVKPKISQSYDLN